MGSGTTASSWLALFRGITWKHGNQGIPLLTPQQIHIGAFSRVAMPLGSLRGASFRLAKECPCFSSLGAFHPGWETSSLEMLWDTGATCWRRTETRDGGGQNHTRKQVFEPGNERGAPTKLSFLVHIIPQYADLLNIWVAFQCLESWGLYSLLPQLL